MSNVSSETLVMGIALTVYDLAMLERYLPQLRGIGIDCAAEIIRKFAGVPAGMSVGGENSRRKRHFHPVPGPMG